ncbi:MAG: sensor histidine kinase [Clostridia bacterium]|nr:sensor histidine kinase [Clostridia bacterium]
MYKSIFAKYVVSFMAIILVSFLIIILTISSIIGDYSGQAKADMMKTAAQSSVTYLENELKFRESYDLKTLIESEEENIREMLAVLASNAEDLTVVLVDADGEIHMAVGSDEEQVEIGMALPAELLQEANEPQGSFLSQNTEQFQIFDQPHYRYACPIYDESEQLCGTVFVCATSVMLTELIEVIVKTIVIASIWVLLASLIAAYLISEKISAPLKEISKAAKSFAAGRFDVRVPVRGEDEVAELAVAFNNMAESLNNYDRMQTTFMSNVSHDLRTPMTSIAGFIDGILDGVIPPEKYEYYLSLVATEVKRLSRLVASLLDLSRIQAGERKFVMSTFDVCEMGRQILISFEQKINEKQLDVSFDCDEESLNAVADRDAIYQVFYNLCDNGVKFASEKGCFRIAVRKLKNRRVLVSVYNEGQGIADEDLPYIFDRFYKSDKSRGLNKSGAGLGLFISKTIVEAHHERIWVESEYGKNCCFNFTLSGE